MLDLNGKSILVTGGTGSFGKKLIETILLKYPKVKRLVVYSRDELKQFEMAQVFSEIKYPAMRYFIGDVRDYPRFKRACQGIDIIVHAIMIFLLWQIYDVVKNIRKVQYGEIGDDTMSDFTKELLKAKKELDKENKNDNK